jgi:hypothetical protein
VSLNDVSIAQFAGDAHVTGNAAPTYRLQCADRHYRWRNCSGRRHFWSSVYQLSQLIM